MRVWNFIHQAKCCKSRLRRYTPFRQRGGPAGIAKSPEIGRLLEEGHRRDTWLDLTYLIWRKIPRGAWLTYRWVTGTRPEWLTKAQGHHKIQNRWVQRKCGFLFSEWLNVSKSFSVDCTCCCFCRAMLCISAAYVVMRCVCVSVCLSRSWIPSKRIKLSSKFFSPSGSHTIQVFPCQTA